MENKEEEIRIDEYGEQIVPQELTEEQKQMIFKFCQDKIDEEVAPKYKDEKVTPEIIEKIKADVSEAFNGIKVDVKQTGDESVEIEFIE